MPFIEEGKAWYCEYEHFGIDEPPLKDPMGNSIDCIFTMHGDTLISDREYKKVFCEFEEYNGDKEQHYYCSVREEAYQVFIIEEETTEEKLIYDFSNPKEHITMTYNGFRFVRTGGAHRYDYRPGQLEYNVCQLSGDEIEYSIGSTCWFDGVGAPINNPFAFEPAFLPFDEPKLGKDLVVRTCFMNGECIYMIEWLAEPTEPYKKCATPTIAYDKGKLVFSCETQGAECVYELKCTDAGSGRGGEVSLSQTYEIRVHATLDGYEDSDVAVATIGWHNGQPVMEGFSSITMEAPTNLPPLGEANADVNGDGKVDVADIATIISVMANVGAAPVSAR